MKKILKAIIVLLVIALLANAYGIYRLTEAEKRISSQVNTNQRYAQKNMDANIRRMQEDVLSIKNNLWVTSNKFMPNVVASTLEEIHLNFMWNLNEVEKGARVYIRYQDRALPGMWVEAEAEEEDINSYSAKMKLSPNSDYVYQIVSEGSYVKVSEITDIPVEDYKPVPFKISGWGYSSTGGKLLDFSVTFSQFDPIFDFYSIKKVRAKIKYFEEEEEEQELESSINRTSGPGQSWDLVLENMQDNAYLERLIIEIEYEGGVLERDFSFEVREIMYEIMNK